MTALTLNIPPVAKLTDEQFYQLCQANHDLRIERTAKGELIIMPPTGGSTGKRNSSLNAQLWLWNQQTQLWVIHYPHNLHNFTATITLTAIITITNPGRHSNFPLTFL